MSSTTTGLVPAGSSVSLELEPRARTKAATSVPRSASASPRRSARVRASAAANAFTRKIDQTSLLGTANVSTQTGVPFATLVERWALANWVSDLPGFTPPAELTYKKWAFRSAYAAVSRWCGTT